MWLVPFVVQVPVPASVKSRLAAPRVSTAGAAMVVLVPKVKVRDVVAGVAVAMDSEPKFDAGVANPATVKVAFCVPVVYGLLAACDACSTTVPPLVRVTKAPEIVAGPETTA